MSRKFWLLLSVMVMMSLVLAACSQQAATPASQEQPAQAEATEAPAQEAPMEEMALLGALGKFGMGLLHGDGNTRQCMATSVSAI